MGEERPPFPPFTLETAIEKVRKAEDAWNTRQPQTVGDRPTMPHAVREGKVSPYDAGGVPPTYGDNAGADSEIGNTRSVPRP